MDQLNAALLTTYRNTSEDLAFSALPDAPRRSDEPGPVRRSLSRGLVRTARWIEPQAVQPTPALQRNG